MSKLKRKHELENKIEEYITNINKEISDLESEFTFISEEDGEIKSRVHYTEIKPGAVLNGNLYFKTAPQISLRFYDSFLLEGEELTRFFAYIDNIKKEVEQLG